MTSRPHTSAEEAQAFHGRRVEARQAQNAKPSFPHLTPDQEDQLFAIFLLDLLTSTPIKEPAPIERIDPIDNNDPPFFKFWKALNAKLNAAGQADADYGFARKAFAGGETPAGALTFIGKEGEGLRAIPDGTYQGLPVYRGEFREVSERGIIWRRVHSSAGAIAYASAEAALHGAKEAQTHSKS
jgi:hypothetical protein